MSATQILVLAFAGIALVASVAIFTVAFRRTDESEQPRTGSLDRKAMRRDRKARKARTPQPEREPALVGAPGDAPPPVDPLLEREEVDEATYDESRRRFFNRGILGIFGLFLAQFGLASLAFMWPRLRAGGFGSAVNAGSVDDLQAQMFTPDGRIVPLFVPAAQSYVVPFLEDPAGSSFEGLPVIAGGLMALWQRCVHLGCRVPTCNASQGFECPCHGSKYNYHGEYEDGPAPRNLDRFAVSLTDTNQLIIDTGTIIETARASTKTIEYPQGPSCI